MWLCAYGEAGPQCLYVKTSSIWFMYFTSIRFFQYVNIHVQAYITNGLFGTQRPYP